MKKTVCPKCGSDDIAKILWGLQMPNSESDKAVKDKKIVLGGCLVSDNDPYWECNDCFFVGEERKD